MDLRERDGSGSGIKNRHPWELSRTRKVLEVFGEYLDRGHRKKGRNYVNVGAGDLFFDKFLLKRYKRDTAYAVDLEYDETVPDYPRIHKAHYLEEVPDGMDYAIMMDSLEYMPEDRAYVKALCDKVRDGGYLFFTLPSTPAVFSEYDHIVKNLRRYDMKSFRRLAASIPGLEVVECQYFYTCLYLVRYLQVHLRLPIDKKRNVTSHWKFSERNLITQGIAGALNMDFALNRTLNKMGIRLPGLSLLVVCRKNGCRKTA